MAVRLLIDRLVAEASCSSHQPQPEPQRAPPSAPALAAQAVTPHAARGSTPLMRLHVVSTVRDALAPQGARAMVERGRTLADRSARGRSELHRPPPAARATESASQRTNTRGTRPHTQTHPQRSARRVKEARGSTQPSAITTQRAEDSERKSSPKRGRSTRQHAAHSKQPAE